MIPSGDSWGGAFSEAFGEAPISRPIGFGFSMCPYGSFAGKAPAPPEPEVDEATPTGGWETPRRTRRTDDPYAQEIGRAARLELERQDRQGREAAKAVPAKVQAKREPVPDIPERDPEIETRLLRALEEMEQQDLRSAARRRAAVVLMML